MENTEKPQSVPVAFMGGVEISARTALSLGSNDVSKHAIPVLVSVYDKIVHENDGARA